MDAASGPVLCLQPGDGARPDDAVLLGQDDEAVYFACRVDVRGAIRGGTTQSCRVRLFSRVCNVKVEVEWR